LVFTDIDCRPQSDWILQLVQPFVNSEIGITGGAIESLPGKTFFEKYAESQKILSQERHFLNPFLPYAATANLAVRRSIFEKIGLFRPCLTTGGDADLCWRMLQNTSFKLHYVPDAVVQHRHRTTLKGLLIQHHRYGRAMKYLSELYNTEIWTETMWNTVKYLLGSFKHWLIKETPSILGKIILGKGSLLDLFKTPIKVLVQQSFSIGQMTAKLPKEAREIQRFNDTL
jgi:cellulose synthase/poly-beta-1,6-N-acetylglucosamine synthase-like glycosyltransferase